MSPDPRPTRPFSLVRTLGKFGWFALQGHALAWWLARHDAPFRQSYRGCRREALAAAWRADPTWADVVAAQGRVTSRSLGLEFLGDDAVSRGYATWLALAPRGWTFRRTDGGLEAKRGELTLALETAEEEEMIREIYLDGCYDLRLPGRWQVVDIGANVGMAALFFAGQPGVDRVVSFEPFGPTADAFARNVARNPALAAKIALRRVGLGEAPGRLEVPYQPDLRGSMSIAGVGDWRGTAAAAGQTVAIDVERASAALAEILAQPPAVRLLAKVDCEGSEYAILRDLASTGGLARFSAFVIEWHGRGPDELTAMLQAAGFALRVQPLSADPRALGLIYATRLPAS
ncbi:MAG TPA: FkbM family methyltransferase [Opitutaceae bacterium]|nr:FkbM family methyltransferase [Opitutaceae bacterium]